MDLQNDRYADQRYLDQFGILFPNVHAVRQKGANLAPWNVGGHRLSWIDGMLMVDGTDSLLFFHVHGLKPLGRHFFLSPADTFQSGTDTFLQQTIYRPYLRSVRATEKALEPFLSHAQPPLRRLSGLHGKGLIPRLKRYLRIARAALAGNLIYMRQ